jgi:hypothetical protein
MDAPPGSQARIAEMVIGALTNYVRGRSEASAQETAENIARYLTQVGEAQPAWLSDDLIVRVKERWRQLNGEWKATPFGKTMRIEFVVSP